MTEDNMQRSLGLIEGQLIGIKDLLKSMDERLSSRDKEVDVRIGKLEDKTDATDARVSKGEQRIAFYIGGAAMLAFVLSNAGSMLSLLHALVK